MQEFASPASEPVRDKRGLERVSNSPLNVLAYDAIRGSIIGGKFQFGERLAEAAISESLGMSRQPVREALIMLRNDGLVVERPRLGAFVPDMSVQDFIDLYNIRVPLETTAVRLLVRNGASLSEIEAVFAEMKDLVESTGGADVADVIGLEFRFHREVFVASGNRHLLRLFESISGPIQLALTLDNTVYAGIGSTLDEHGPVLEALLSGVEDLAVDAMGEHIMASFVHVVTRLQGDVNAIVWPLPSPGSEQHSIGGSNNLQGDE